MAKLYFRYAAMNAGKSTMLLQVAHNYEEKSCDVLLFTAAVDNRAGATGLITSRIGMQREANVFTADTDFRSIVKDLDYDLSCILIDEAQFLSEEQVRQLHQVASLEGIPVICYGLRSDFRANLFPGSAALLMLADTLEEIKTICECGKKATMNLRVDASGKPVLQGNQIEIGGNGRYRSLCPTCYYIKVGIE